MSDFDEIRKLKRKHDLAIAPFRELRDFLVGPTGSGGFIGSQYAYLRFFFDDLEGYTKMCLDDILRKIDTDFDEIKVQDALFTFGMDLQETAHAIQSNKRIKADKVHANVSEYFSKPLTPEEIDNRRRDLLKRAKSGEHKLVTRLKSTAQDIEYFANIVAREGDYNPHLYCSAAQFCLAADKVVEIADSFKHKIGMYFFRGV